MKLPTGDYFCESLAFCVMALSREFNNLKPQIPLPILLVRVFIRFVHLGTASRKILRLYLNTATILVKE